MPTKVSGQENKMCEKKQRVLPKLEKITLLGEEDVMRSSIYNRQLEKLWDFFSSYFFSGERKCNELQQEEFKTTEALRKIVLDG